MAEDVKKLKKSLDKDFLGFKNNQLTKSYKNVNDYLTDGGKVPVGSAVYNRRMAAYSKFSEEWKANLNEAGVQSGKLLPAYQQQIEKMYPSLAAYMKQYPELQQIFRDAVTSPTPPSAQILNTKMRGTQFWQTLTDSSVEYDTANDATRQQMTDGSLLKIQTLAQSSGVKIDINEAKFKDLAVKSVREGWTDQMVSNALGGLLVEDDEDVIQLRQGLVGTKVNQTLDTWGYPTRGGSRQEFVNQWISKIATGAESTDTLQTYMKEQAKVWYPSFANEFEAGRTFKQVVDPYARIAASTLEKNQESIDWTDPLYSQALNQGPEKGNAPMSFADWNKKLRTDASYGWNQTQQANDLAATIGRSLTRAFGKVK
jgi:hypothetical protein